MSLMRCISTVAEPELLVCSSECGAGQQYTEQTGFHNKALVTYANGIMIAEKV